MHCPYCGRPDVPAGTPCPVCGAHASAAAETELGKLRFLLIQLRDWEERKLIPPDACRLLRKRYADALERFGRLLADPAARPANEADYPAALGRVISELSKADPAASPEGVAAVPAAATPVDRRAAGAPAGPETPASPPAQPEPAVEGIVFLTPDAAAAAPPGDPKRGEALARLYGRPGGAPEPVPPTAQRPAAARPEAPPGAPPAAGPTPERAAPPTAGPATPLPTREPAAPSPGFQPLEEELPLAERLRNLLTERNVRILFNVGLAILFGGLAIFIRIYWAEYSRAQQVGYLLFGTAAVAAAGLFLRRTEMLRTSGSYLLVAASVCVPLDIYAWTRADILPLASGNAIGLFTGAGGIALYAGLLGWLRERVLAYLTVLSLVTAYAFGLRVLGVDLDHLAAWMPLLFAGLTAASGHGLLGDEADPETAPSSETSADAESAPAPAPPTPPASAVPVGTESGGTDLVEELRLPLRWAAIAGTPLSLLVAAFQFILAGGFARPEDWIHLQVLYHTSAGHAWLARVRHRRHDVMWLAAGLHGLALYAVFDRWIPRTAWGPWAMALGAAGAYIALSLRRRIGSGSVYPYQALFYLMMAAALVDSGIRFLGQPDSAHAGPLLITLAFPTAAWMALSVQPDNERYAIRAAALIHAEVVLFFFWLGWSGSGILTGAAVCSAVFILLGTREAAGAWAAYPTALRGVGYAGILLGLVAAVLVFLGRLWTEPFQSAQAAASYGLAMLLVAVGRKDGPHLAAAVVLLTAAATAAGLHLGLAWNQIPVIPAAAAVLLAGLSFSSASWVSIGAGMGGHLAALAAALLRVAGEMGPAGAGNLPMAADAGLLAVAYGLHGAVSRRASGASADALESAALLLAGIALGFLSIHLGLTANHAAVALAALGGLYFGLQRVSLGFPGRAFHAAAGALTLLALGSSFGLALWHHLATGTISHGEAALASCAVVAILIASALVEDRPAGLSATTFAGAAAVFFAYPYVSLAWAAIAAPAGRITALAGLCILYTLVERAVRDTRWSVLGAPTAVMNFLAVVATVLFGIGYGIANGDASLASLGTGLAAALLTYYAFAAAPPPAFPPLIASSGSALLFTASYSLFLTHISTGSNLGGIAFLASTYVLGIVSLVLRHRGRTPQWIPYFVLSLVNAAISLLSALPFPGIRVWVLFGLTLLFGGYGIVLERKVFTYGACLALTGAYVSLLESFPGIQRRHYVFWILALAMAKTVAGGFLARREEKALEAGAPPARPVHPAFHVGVGLSFLAVGLVFMDASYYLKAEYWLAIGCAWGCAVLYVLAWLVARQDLYLILSAMSVAGSYFIWLQNQDTKSWEWYTLPLGVMAIAWARTMGARRLDPEQTRTVDSLALMLTLLPSILQSFSSLRTVNAAMAFVLSVVMVLLGMSFKRKLYLVAGIAGVIVELVIQIVHLIDFRAFGAVHYFILIGAAVMCVAMVLNYFLSKSMQAKASEARARMREWFQGWQ